MEETAPPSEAKQQKSVILAHFWIFAPHKFISSFPSPRSHPKMLVPQLNTDTNRFVTGFLLINGDLFHTNSTDRINSHLNTFITLNHL